MPYLLGLEATMSGDPNHPRRNGKESMNL